MTAPTHPFISIIIPVFNEEKNIAPIATAISSVMKKYDSYELLFINDGSHDNTAQNIQNLAESDKKIKLISFVRNFGHQMALSAGYEHAKGDCIVSLDADMQDPPELIPKFITAWQAGNKIVYAKREKRDEGFFKQITAHFFYRVINMLSDIHIPMDVGDFRLLDREVVDLLNKLPEKSRFLRGLVAWGGFTSTAITFNRGKRLSGQTHYPFSKMVNFALDGIVSFSTKPLKIASYLGMLTSIFGFFGMVYAIVRRFVLPHDYWVTGWTALFVSIMFFGGIQLLTIGIIGEYVGKIYKEIQGRPQYLIKEKINI